MSYLDRNLLDGEKVVYRTHLHWTVYYHALLLIVLALACFGAAAVYPDAIYPLLGVGAVALVIGLVIGFFRWLDKISSEFGVTDKRVIIKVGLVKRRSIELLLRQVEGIGVEQSVAGRVFGFGEIVIAGTGGTKEVFRRIADPLEFRKQVQAQSIR
jgi:uncharacterized membrane protein YdbT with pleckstrin-like domain